jgi:hypothetical protein
LYLDLRLYPVKVKIGFPYKIGCDRGGGDWQIIKGILHKYFDGEEFDVEIWEWNP